jgi:hypothetical protein
MARVWIEEPDLDRILAENRALKKRCALQDQKVQAMEKELKVYKWVEQTIFGSIVRWTLRR